MKANVPPGHTLHPLAPSGYSDRSELPIPLHPWPQASLLCNMRTIDERPLHGTKPLHSPVFPLSPCTLVVDRSGDLAGSRGETRDQSTAEIRGLLSSVSLPIIRLNALARRRR